VSDALARLAAAYCILPEYHDIWGTQHRVADATIVALLAAMGVDAADDAKTDMELRAHDAALDERGIAPLVVLRENVRPWTLRCRLPRALEGTPLAVRVICEDDAELDNGRLAYARADSSHADGGTCIGVELTLSASLPPGYHRIELSAGETIFARTTCAVAPAACYVPVPPSEGRTWGATVQLYGVRSERNWGIGDFTDLATLSEQWGARGAGIVGVNPLHALFPDQPWHASPYSPSSRMFRNTLYLDVEAIAEFRECAEARALVASSTFQGTLAKLREAPLVDYAGVAQAKRTVLEMLYRYFRAHHLEDARADAFRAYLAAGGDALRRHALFEALQEHFHGADPEVWGWPAWPPHYRDPASTAVARFAAEHAERIEYFAYLQWQAELQLAAAADRARVATLSIGIYTDLAVSIDRGGAEAWANQSIYAMGASVGAPPDAFNMRGQDWGLPPLVPARLAAAGYAPFLATLRATMRHAGALRVDHVMGLARLFWVPAGSEPADGAYVQYPFDDLLGLLALESHRHRCIVIGEDLGTVPDYVRAALQANAILSYRVLIFERDAAGEFKAPAAYPPEALATTGTHDLPTLAGWWSGADIDLRAANGLIATDADRDAQVRERTSDRIRMLAALRRAGLLMSPVATHAPADRSMESELARAIQSYLAATPSRLQVIQLEDVVGVQDQANLPGTTDAYPNWRWKLPLPLERWPHDARFDALARTLATERPRPPSPRPGSAESSASVTRVPRATYRLQLNRAFTFADTEALIPYLAALGVSHVYCSPYLRARPGSLHGYDIVDHSEINPEIGTRADFDRFVATLDAHGMGHLCDVVPNHVGVMGADNRWWMDVLENGPASEFADYFDIDWAPFDPAFRGRLVVPVLGDPYGVVLERGELKLAFEADGGGFAVRYYDHRFPIDPRECPPLLAEALERCRDALAPDVGASVARLVATLRALPARSVTATEALARRRNDGAACKATLVRLARAHPPLAKAIDQVVAGINGTPGDAATFEVMHALLEAQAFRLAHWRVASDEINYRRFFDVNDLAALRMENDDAFDATHAFILQLAAEGKIHGLRIDHPDGLYDPGSYVKRLQTRYRQYVAEMRPQPEQGVAPLYVVLEKISASHERLPEDWPVNGTTGYRFANAVNGLFVDRSAKLRLDRAWRAFVGADADDYGTTVLCSKVAIMRGPLAAELTMVTNRALRIARADPNTRDFTFNALREAIEEIVARFPVYRTYVSEGGASAQDRRYIDWAIARARRESRRADPSVFDFMRALMLATPPPHALESRAAEYRAFAMRFQQFTAPVTAKGVEDTAFYRFNRLVSVNDVGSDPDEFGTTVRAFHGASQDRATAWPTTMLATSTHDNKRSGDVRARVDVISEVPAIWRLAVRRWSRLNRSRKRHVDGRNAPSRNDEYLLYQTLVGTFPARGIDDDAMAQYVRRIRDYMVKAAREAKVHTSWLSVDADYEAALVAFVSALLAGGEHNLFLDDLRAQIGLFAWFGQLNSVSMSLLKFTSPGVPDIYQGTELVDLRLVDPDNRVAVDYVVRRAVLEEFDALAGAGADQIARAIAGWFAAGDGRAKMWVMHRLLRFRAVHRELMTTQDYLPVHVAGARADHVVAFARRLDNHGIIAVAGRLFASLGLDTGTLPVGEEAWADTMLDLGFVPAGARLANVLTGEVLDARVRSLPLAEVFRHFPGAVLHYEQRD